MKTRAFWSVRKLTFLPNTYLWLCTMPKTGTKNYFSIWEYFLSANGSAPLPDITGWPWSLALCWSTLAEALEYWWFFNSVVDLLEGFVSLAARWSFSYECKFRVNSMFDANFSNSFLGTTRYSLRTTQILEVKIFWDVWGLELMRYCCYLLATSYLSRFSRRVSVQSQLKLDQKTG